MNRKYFLLFLGLAFGLGLGWFMGNKNKPSLTQTANEPKRSITSSQPTESMMSEQWRNLRDEFLAIKTSDELEAKLKFLDSSLNSSWDSLPQDYKLIALQAALILPLRGLVYKLIPVVDDDKITHNYLLSMVMSVSNSVNIFALTDQWKVGFEYLTEPYNNIVQFQKETDVQDYILNFVYPKLSQAKQRLENLGEISETNPVVWDRTILTGAETLKDNLDRFKTFGEVERQMRLTQVNIGLHNLIISSVYSAEGIMKYISELSKVIVLDSLKGKIDDIGGATDKQRADIIMKNGFKNLFTLRTNLPKEISATTHLTNALQHLEDAVRHRDKAWELLQLRPENEYNMLNSRKIIPFERRINLSFNTTREMLLGPTSVKSEITGESVQVNIREFYLNPPTDLKDFVGTDFIKSEDDKYKEKAGIKFRNYEWGRATKWNLEAYQRFFPDVKADDDLRAHLRILEQSWGSGMAESPISNFIL